MGSVGKWMLARDCLSVRFWSVVEEAELGVGRALSIGKEDGMVGEFLRDSFWEERRMCDASGGFG